ncbi:hypothetical protein L6452_32828 [Arctium lappa]|uniref:Uncharacterized protein n=1 Tax=Arctium lappa TaxID=4217 RepID=A0ACB8Z5F1_ARCLA|nr:hypothetical protein L6452_32828 [Arctium lappa]
MSHLPQTLSSQIDTTESIASSRKQHRLDRLCGLSSAVSVARRYILEGVINSSLNRNCGSDFLLKRFANKDGHVDLEKSSWSPKRCWNRPSLSLSK